MLSKLRNVWKNENIKLIVAALVLFMGVLAFVPSASTLRSYPLLPVASVVALAVCGKSAVVCIMSFVFSFCMYSVYGFSLGASLAYGAFSAFVTLLCASLVATWHLVRKSSKTSGARPYRSRFVIIVFVILCAYFSVCSDPVSANNAHKRNTEYVREKYGDKVQCVNTYYSFSDFALRTCVHFEDDGNVLGKDGSIYVCVSEKGTYDGVREYNEEKMLADSEKALASVLSGATDAFDVLCSDIEFADGEILEFGAQAEKYYNRTHYVVGLYSITETETDFERLASDCAKALLSADNFTFESISLCGGTSDEVLYSVCFANNTNPSDIKKLVRPFDSKNGELHGVDNEKFLEYWN